MRGLVRLHPAKAGLHLEDVARRGTVFDGVWSSWVCARRERCGASEVALRLFAEMYKVYKRAMAVYIQSRKLKEQR